jgi:flagellar basal-body rod protein FlgG
MNGAFSIGAVGLQAQQKALEVHANNVVNVNTPAFKRTSVRFTEVLAQNAPAADIAGASAPRLAGVEARSVLAHDEVGDIERTNAPLDIAIDGNGFIELNGAQGETLLWRGGRLTINPDGFLAGPNGHALRAMIVTPKDMTAIEVGREGVVRAKHGARDEWVEIGRLSLVQIGSGADIEQRDGGLLAINHADGLIDSTPGVDGAGSFIQGARERSNVSLNDEMVQIMIVQRAFAANAQIIQAADQLMAMANNLRK